MFACHKLLRGLQVVAGRGATVGDGVLVVPLQVVAAVAAGFFYEGIGRPRHGTPNGQLPLPERELRS